VFSKPVLSCLPFFKTFPFSLIVEGAELPQFSIKKTGFTMYWFLRPSSPSENFKWRALFPGMIYAFWASSYIFC